MQKERPSHLFTNLSKKELIVYAASFGISPLVLLFLRLYFLSGHGILLSGALSPARIVFNGLAGLCFLIYLKNTTSFSAPSTPVQLALSLSYGLCTYGIAQEVFLPVLVLYAVYPLIFLAFEQMTEGRRYLPFLVGMSAAFILHPASSVPMALLLLILSVAELSLHNRLSLGSFMHVTACFTLSFLLGSFRLFPYWESLSTGSSYPGFALSYPAAMFLSRFFPFGSIAIAFSSDNGFDLYCGTLSILLAALFFTSPSVEKRRKLVYGFFTALTASVIGISPIRHLFCLGFSDNRYTVYYSFLLTFCLLRIAAEGTSGVESAVRFTKLLPCLFVTLLLVACSYLFFYQNFPRFALPATLLFVLGYLFLLYRKTSFSAKLLPVLLLLELSASALTATNLGLLPSSRSMQVSNLSASLLPQSSDETSAKNTDPEKAPNADAYRTFFDSHSESAEVEQLAALLDLVDLDSKEYNRYCGTSLPNTFERFNGLAHKIGADEDLFFPAQTEITFESSKEYQIAPISDNLYYFRGEQSHDAPKLYFAPYTILASDTDDIVFFQNDTMHEMYYLTADELKDTPTAYTRLVNNLSRSLSFQILSYKLNRNVYDQLPALMQNYASLTQASGHSSGFIGMFRMYLGFILSCIGLLIFFTLYFNSDKQKVYDALVSCRQALDRLKLPRRIAAHVKENFIYYLAFAVPFLLIVSVMVITDSAPFGIYSLFAEDGTALTIPSYLDSYYNWKQGNLYLSLNGGFGYNQYNMHPLVETMFYFRLLRAEQIPTLLILCVAVCTGFAGFGMVFYMTHRLSDERAKKTDYRLLVPAMIYSANTYMLSMHNFAVWFLTLMIFPILILTMEYLIYRKKYIPYILVLSYCITMNWYLSFYMCIFLAICFFTCRFDSWKDFLAKGIRFAICSLLSAGNGFFIIYGALTGTSDSLYRYSDQEFPSLGFHTRFLEQWKQHMPFTDITCVSTDNGDVSLYCSVAAVILMLLYFSCKRIRLSTRLKKLFLVVLLYLSFNGIVLSFLWNGLHYQSKVPNRYVFLLMFLIAEICYDILHHLREISVLHFAAASILVIGLFSFCQFGSSGNETISYAAAIALCAVYPVLFLLDRRRSGTILLSLLLIAELCINAVYAFQHYALQSFLVYGNFAAVHDTMEEVSKDQPFSRTAFPFTVNGTANQNTLYGVPGTDLFNSFVTAHQNFAATLYGYYPSGNSVRDYHNSTQFSNMLSATRYIAFAENTGSFPKNMQPYNYLGKMDTYYLFENPQTLSVGFYAPYEITSLSDYVQYPLEYYNQLAKLYTGKDDPLYTFQEIHFNRDESAEDSFCFTDGNGTQIEPDDAYAMYSTKEEDNEIPMGNLRLRFHYTPHADGYVYLYAKEIVGVDYVHAGEETVSDIAFPNLGSGIINHYLLAFLHEDVQNNFYEIAGKNQWEDLVVHNDTITGTTHYEKDGYTMLSLAYDKGWHAYIDGVETQIEDPFQSIMFVPTPAGDHTLTLKYIPYGMRFGKMVSLLSWILTITLFVIYFLLRRKAKPADEQEIIGCP